MSKVPISVCIIAKNEEKYIEGCLKNLKPLGVEIIVTDTGSIDRTKEIAEKYADKVLDFEWIDDFAAARNFCAEHATNNWILALDCDEYMNEFDYPKIRIMMQRMPKSVGMFHLKNLLIGTNGEQTFTVDDVMRFYNKKRFTWENPIHEQLVKINDDDKSKYHCFLMPMEVIHHGYNITPGEMVEKQLRNLRLLQKQLETDLKNAYAWFQMGQSQFILNNYEKAVEAYEISLSLDSNPNKYYVEILLESLSKIYAVVGRPEDALKVLLEHAEGFNTAKYVFAIAQAYLKNNQIIQALMHYIKASSMSDRHILGDDLFTCYDLIIKIYKDMGENDMAAMYTDLLEKCKQEKERVLNA